MAERMRYRGGNRLRKDSFDDKSLLEEVDSVQYCPPPVYSEMKDRRASTGGTLDAGDKAAARQAQGRPLHVRWLVWLLDLLLAILEWISLPISHLVKDEEGGEGQHSLDKSRSRASIVSQRAAKHFEEVTTSPPFVPSFSPSHTLFSCPHFLDNWVRYLSSPFSLGGLQGQYEQSIESYKEVMTIFQQESGEGSIRAARVLMKIGRAYRRLEKFDEALAHFQKCLGVLEQDERLGLEAASIRREISIGACIHLELYA